MINKMKAMLLIHEDGYVPCTDELWNKIALEIHETQQMKKELESKIKLLTNQLIALSQDKNTCGLDFYFQKIERKGTVDYSLIPELKNVNLELYRKSDSTYWKLDSY